MRVQSPAGTRSTCAISDVRHTIAHPAALLRFKTTKDDIIFDLFRKLLGIRTIVTIFIRKTAV
jgi:hypothetical protein